MKDKKQRRPIAERINDYLREPEGETFKAGKWRFWFPTVILLCALNAVMTAYIFATSNVDSSRLIGASSGISTAIVGVAVSVGCLACWLAVGNLHYSDAGDIAMARRVSLLDSAALCFVVAHFCFLLWALGHLVTLRAAEDLYKAEVRAYNVKAENVQADNVKIAEAAQTVARETTKAERLRRQTAYQQRKAAEAGARIRQSAQAGNLAPSLSTAPVELERPKAPAESSTVFLSKWDAWIRIANFGELILAAITLIYIRNRSASYNAPYLSGKGASLRFSEGGAGVVSPRSATVAAFDAKKATVATVAEGRESALEVLREHLGVLSSYLPGQWFKADLIKGGVTIRLCARNDQGREVTVKQTRQSNKLLAAVNRRDFRKRLIGELTYQGFPIGGKR